MQSGGLRRLVTVIAPGPEIGRDAVNAVIRGPACPVDLLAEHQAVSDAERMSAGEVSASLTARYRVRWSPTTASIRPTWSLLCEGRAFDIVGVKEIGHREAIEITAAARAE